jgi:hypothetical protein
MVWFYGTNWGTTGFGTTLRFEEGAMLTSQFGEAVFPSLLNGRSIGPGVTVAGQIFLEAPKHGFDGAMRCRVIDGTDGEFLELVKPVQATNYLDTWLPSGAGEAQFRETEDLTRFPIVRFSELMNPIR